MSKFGAKLLGSDNEPMLLREDSVDIEPSGGGSLGYNSMLMRPDGTVMSKDHIKELRQRQGFCLTCEGEPTKLFAIKKSKLNPLWNKKDPVNVIHISYDGTCLRCNPTMDPHRGSRGPVGSVNSMLPGSLHSLNGNQGLNSRRRSSLSASGDSADSLQSSTRNAHSPVAPSMARMASISSTQSAQNHRGSWSPTRQSQTLTLAAPSALKRSKSIERSYSSDDTDHNLSGGLAKLRPLRRSNSDESVNNQGTGGRSGPGRQLMRSNSDDSLMVDFGAPNRAGRRVPGGHRRSNSDESVNDFKKFLMKRNPPPEVQELERQSSDRTFRYVKQAAAAAAAAASVKKWKEQTAMKTKEAAEENGGRRAQMERKESVDQDGFLEPEPGEAVIQPSATNNLFNDSFAGFQDIKTVDSFLEKHNKKIREKEERLGEESKPGKSVPLSAPKNDKPTKNGIINPPKSDTAKEKKKSDAITIPGPPSTPKRSSSINRGRATPESLPPVRNGTSTSGSVAPESVTPATSQDKLSSQSLADKEFQGKLVVDIVSIQSDLRGLATTNNSRFDQLERQMAAIWSQQKILLQQNTVIIEMLELQADNMKKQMEQQHQMSAFSSGLGLVTKDNHQQTSSEHVTEKGSTAGIDVTDVTESRRSSGTSSRSRSRRKMESAGEYGKQLSSTHLFGRQLEKDISSGGKDETPSQPPQNNIFDEESETSKSRRKREKAEKKRSSSTPASTRSIMTPTVTAATTPHNASIIHAPEGRELNRDDSGNQISVGEKSTVSSTTTDTLSSDNSQSKSFVSNGSTSNDELAVYKNEQQLSTSFHSNCGGVDGGTGDPRGGEASDFGDVISPTYSQSDDVMLSDLKRRKSMRKEKKKSSKKEKRKSFTNKDMAAAAAACMLEVNDDAPMEYEIPLSQY